MNTEIIKFDYTKEALDTMKQEALSIDTTDKNQLESVVKVLVKARGIIQKQGKSFRDEANAYNKAVLQKEKEYLEIIEPIELDYKNKIVEIEKEQVRQERLLVLPQRKSLLSLLTTITQPSDDVLLSFDDTSFMSYLNERQAENQRNIDNENARVKREQEIAENAKKEAEENAKKQIQEANERAERAVKEAEEKAKREKEAEEIRKQKEQEELEKNKAYQNFLKNNGYTEETKDEYFVKETNGEYVLYKKIATLNK
jgi:hypothetical protein